MTTFESKVIKFNIDPEKIFGFLGNLNNFEEIMPDQVENWESDADQCSFFIRNLGMLGMWAGDFNNSGELVFQSTEKSKTGFQLIYYLESKDETVAVGQFKILVEVNSMLEMMVRRPLTNFVNLLNEKLRQLLCG